MGSVRRISNVLMGLVMIAAGGILGLMDDGFPLVMLILGLMLVFKGFSKLLYYLTMARFMVGGKMILFTAVFMLDVGCFTLTQIDIPHMFVLLYLLIIYASSGVIQLLRGLEAKRLQSPTWKRSVAMGMVNISVAILCIIFHSKNEPVLWAFCLGIIYSGVMRIYNALRKTAIVYIQ